MKTIGYVLIAVGGLHVVSNMMTLGMTSDPLADAQRSNSAGASTLRQIDLLGYIDPFPGALSLTGIAVAGLGLFLVMR